MLNVKNAHGSVLDNWSWWRDVGAVRFVAEVARPFRVVSMLSKDRSGWEWFGVFLMFTVPCVVCSVSQRMASEEGMSCAEFLYPCFQAFDFLHLHTHHACWTQVWSPSLSCAM